MFAGKTVIVTGASSGIGLASANMFHEEGASTVLVARRGERLDAIRRQMKAPEQVLTVAGDVTEEALRRRVVAESLERFGQIDILINCAGILEGGSLEKTTLSDWERMFLINVTAPFHLMQLCLPSLKAVKGNVVNVSSITGLRAFPGILAYCASKAALDQMTRCAALELAADGVRVNGINPGVIETHLHRAGGMAEEAYRAFLEHSRTTHPLGRVGRAEEAAALIGFLASEKGAWITGVNYAIDGGRGQTCLR
jgi:NAD(P)-dependent dehydrogenase (short-subunit alcohol dehydrogenase family)